MLRIILGKILRIILGIILRIILGIILDNDIGDNIDTRCVLRMENPGPMLSGYSQGNQVCFR